VIGLDTDIFGPPPNAFDPVRLDLAGSFWYDIDMGIGGFFVDFYLLFS
jgi:hypothetical protein